MKGKGYNNGWKEHYYYEPSCAGGGIGGSSQMHHNGYDGRDSSMSTTSSLHNNHMKMSSQDMRNITDIALRQLRKCEMCLFHMTPGMVCKKGDTCPYAHSRAELQVRPNLEKTAICPKVREGKECVNKYCKYAHKASELRFTDEAIRQKQNSEKVLASRPKDEDIDVIAPPPPVPPPIPPSFHPPNASQLAEQNSISLHEDTASRSTSKHSSLTRGYTFSGESLSLPATGNMAVDELYNYYGVLEQELNFVGSRLSELDSSWKGFSQKGGSSYTAQMHARPDMEQWSGTKGEDVLKNLVQGGGSGNGFFGFGKKFSDEPTRRLGTPAGRILPYDGEDEYSKFLAELHGADNNLNNSPEYKIPQLPQMPSADYSSVSSLIKPGGGGNGGGNKPSNSWRERTTPPGNEYMNLSGESYMGNPNNADSYPMVGSGGNRGFTNLVNPFVLPSAQE